MGNGKGGTSTQQQSSTVAPPADVLAKYGTAWNASANAANQPFTPYGGEFVAPINPYQQAAFGQINAAVPSSVPAFNAAAAGLGAAGSQYSYASGSAQPFNAFAGALIPGAVNASNTLTPDQINQFMSPYIQGVVDPTTAWLNQQNKLQQNDLVSNEVANGSFGGDRSDIAAATLYGQQNKAEAPIIGGLYNQGWSQALAAAQQQQAQRVGALQQGASQAQGLAGQLFGQNMATGQAYQGLAGAEQGFGQNTFQNQLQYGQAMLGAGTLQQQTQQGLDQALYNQFLMQQAYPFQTAQFLTNTAGTLGPLYGTTTNASGSSFQPQPFFSDDRLKEDVREIGRTKEGLKIIRYRYKDDPDKLLRLGFLASDVEKKMPEAVSEHKGLKTVDYDRAARADGGVASNDDGLHYWDTLPERNAPFHDAQGNEVQPGDFIPGSSPALDRVWTRNDPQVATGELPEERLATRSARGRQNAYFPDATDPQYQSADKALARKLFTGVDPTNHYYSFPQAQARGGLVGANDMHEGFAQGGDAASYWDAILHATPHANAMPSRASSGTGPYGMQASPAARASLMRAEPLQWNQKQPESVAKEVTDDVKGATDFGKGAEDTYKFGRGLAVGSPEVRDPVTGKVTTPATSGAFGVGGTWDPSNGVIGRNVSDLWPTTQALDTSVAPGGSSDAFGGFSPQYAQGGRLKRAVGGLSLPYDTGADPYFDPQPIDPKTLAAQRSLISSGPGGMGGGSSSGSGTGLLGTASQLAGLGKSAVDIGSGLGLFGGAGAAGTAATGAGSAADLFALGFLANRGGRIGYQDGGEPQYPDPMSATRTEEQTPSHLRDEEPVKTRTAPSKLPAFEMPGASRLLSQPLPPDLNPEASVRRDLAADPASVLPPQPEPGYGMSSVAPSAAPAEPTPHSQSDPPPPAVPPSPPSTAISTAPGVAPTAASAPTDAFNSAVAFTLNKEGGKAIDSNGALVNRGINAAYHPGVDVANLTEDQARDIYKREYWDAIGGDKLDPKIQRIAFDTAVVEGPQRANQWLQESGGDPAKFLALRQAHEENLVRTKPDVYGKYAQGWANRRAELGGGVSALNSANNTGSALAGGIGPASSIGSAGVAPPQDWWDRNITPNMKWLSPALNFLGGMFSSPSRTLAGSIGTGLVGAAKGLVGQQELGQGQQRINITNRAQLMNVWTQVSARLAALKATNATNSPEYAQLVAQEAELRRQIMAADGTVPGGPQTAPGGAGVAPTPTASQNTPNAPAPAPVAGNTPTGTMPAGTPAAPVQKTPSDEWWPQSQAKPWVPSQTQPDYGSLHNNADPRLNIAQESDPAYWQQKAAEVAGINPALAAAFQAREVAAQNMLNEGKYQSQGAGLQKVPGFEEYQASQAQAGENQTWLKSIGDVQQQRNAARAQLQTIKESLETLHTGPLAPVIQAVASRLANLGMDTSKIIPGDLSDPAAYDKFMKSALNVVLDSLQHTGSPTDARMNTIAHASPNTELNPEANRHILAQLMALNDQNINMTSGAINEMNTYKSMNRPVFQDHWQKAHPLEKDIDAAERNIAAAGATPMIQHKDDDGRVSQVPDVSKMKVGQMYIVSNNGQNTKARFMGIEKDANGKPVSKWSPQ